MLIKNVNVIVHHKKYVCVHSNREINNSLIISYLGNKIRIQKIIGRVFKCR